MLPKLSIVKRGALCLSKPQGKRCFASTSSKLDKIKVTPSIAPEALFDESLIQIRRQNWSWDPDVDTAESNAVIKLRADEISLTHKIFDKIFTEGQMAIGVYKQVHEHIDPYWNPFNQVEDLRARLTLEWTELSSLLTTAEKKISERNVRRAFNAMLDTYNPYHKQHTEFYKKVGRRVFPVPHHSLLHEQFWNPSARHRERCKRKITWRDLDILNHFISENGLITPRRLTLTPSAVQKRAFKAICTARHLALIPVDWNDKAKLPFKLPLQHLLDSVTNRYTFRGDLRAKAMVETMMAKYPKLNYYEFLTLEANLAKGEQEKPRPTKYELDKIKGSIQKVLYRYRRETTLKPLR
eukprot:Platyproteum_vivax@DN16133_c0_g1_i1.p1